MEPINTVFIKKEHVTEDTEQEDSVSIADRSTAECNNLVLCCEQNNICVEENLRVTSTLSVRSHMSNISAPHATSDCTLPVITPLLYTCAICLQYFSTCDLLISHVFSHDQCVNSPLHICQNCCKVFVNLSKLQAHYLQDSRETSFIEPSVIELVCAFCADSFLSWCSLTKHVFSHISASSAPMYCSHGFDDNDNDKLHLNKHTSRTSKRRECRRESDTYNQDLVTGNIEKEVASTSRRDSLKSEQNHKRNKPQEERSVTCKMYGKSFTLPEQLKKHQKIHSCVQPFYSNVCCEDCGKSFTRSHSLKRHQRIHSEEYPFCCKVCGKCFKWPSSFQTHLKTHSEKRPYWCDVCGKSFKRPDTLQCHQRIHSGERPFCCKICGKSFTQQPHLQTHLRIHSGERPFCCKVCGNTFSHATSYKRHQTIH